MSEDRIMMCQGLNPPVITVFGRTSIVSTCRGSGLLYVRFMGQQWLDKLITTYPLDDIEIAIRDMARGKALKPVLIP